MKTPFATYTKNDVGWIWNCSCGSVGEQPQETENRAKGGYNDHLHNVHKMDSVRKRELPCPDCGERTRSVGYPDQRDYKTIWVRAGRFCPSCKSFYPALKK